MDKFNAFQWSKMVFQEKKSEPMNPYIGGLGICGIILFLCIIIGHFGG